MSQKDTSLLRQLLDEKDKKDLGNISKKYYAFNVNMHRVLADYANAYLCYYFLSGPDIVNTFKKRLEIYKKESPIPIKKTGTELSKYNLNKKEKEYLDEIFTIVDAANNYLIEGNLNLETLVLLRKVLDFYCYGKE